MWKGEWVEKSTRQGNKEVARQMEAAYRTGLAKSEFGIVERQPAPTLRRFAEDSFLLFVASTFANQKKTKEYYEYGVKCLLGFDGLADKRLDSITSEGMGAYTAARQAVGNQITCPASTKSLGQRQLFLPIVLPQLEMLPNWQSSLADECRILPMSFAVN